MYRFPVLCRFELRERSRRRRSGRPAPDRVSSPRCSCSSPVWCSRRPRSRRRRPRPSTKIGWSQWGARAARPRASSPHPRATASRRSSSPRRTSSRPSDPIPTELNVFHVQHPRDDHRATRCCSSPATTWDPERIEESERNLRKQYIIAVARIVAGEGQGRRRRAARRHQGPLEPAPQQRVHPHRLAAPVPAPAPHRDELPRAQPAAGARLHHEARHHLARPESSPSGASSARAFYFRRGGRPRLQPPLRRAGGHLRHRVSFGRPLITLEQTVGRPPERLWNVGPRRLFRGARGVAARSPSGGTVPYEYDVREGDVELSGTRSSARNGRPSSPARSAGTPTSTRPRPRWASTRRAGSTSSRTRCRAPRARPTPPRRSSSSRPTTACCTTSSRTSSRRTGRWAPGSTRRCARRCRPSSPRRSFIEAAAAARYRFLATDNLLSLAVAGSTRFRPGDTPANQRLVFELREFSPKFEGGRVAWRLLVDLMRNDLDHRVLFLGGSNGLRGTLPEAFSGRNVIVSNLEWRLRPFEILSQWLALVAFYDVGAAYDVTPRLTHTLGFGLRLLAAALQQRGDPRRPGLRRRRRAPVARAHQRQLRQRHRAAAGASWTSRSERPLGLRQCARDGTARTLFG